MPTYKSRKCKLCIDQVKYIDYKNLSLLYKYMSQYKKIVPKYYSGNCLKHQKMLSKAIKNARMMALIPFTAQ
ncbi:MAG: 30S ribosomal protein S18 [Candidatus Gracilibacteria bacterium]|jgi:small subunit ribosomal protein S18